MASIISGYAIIIMAIQIILCRSSAVIEVKFHQYNNYMERTAEDSCCDFLCFGACDHKFTFCLDKPPLIYSMGACIKSMSTGVYKNTNINYFNGISMKADLERWEGSLVLKVDILDVDTVGPDDSVDTMYTTLPMSIPGSISQKKWVKKTIYGARRTDKTRLQLSYTVYCKRGWTGKQCNQKCIPGPSGCIATTTTIKPTTPSTTTTTTTTTTPSITTTLTTIPSTTTTEIRTTTVDTTTTTIRTTTPDTRTTTFTDELRIDTETSTVVASSYRNYENITAQGLTDDETETHKGVYIIAGIGAFFVLLCALIGFIFLVYLKRRNRRATVTTSTDLKVKVECKENDYGPGPYIINPPKVFEETYEKENDINEGHYEDIDILKLKLTLDKSLITDEVSFTKNEIDSPYADIGEMDI